MKSIFLATALLTASFAAQAAPALPCPSQVRCGVYEAEADDNGVTAGFNVTPADKENEAHLIFTFRTKDGTELENLDLHMIFAEDTSFKALQNGRPWATGICRNLVCTYAVFPHSGPDGMNGMGGVLTFKENSLEQASFLSNDKGQAYGLSIYNKK